jgi:hypothetical protein
MSQQLMEIRTQSTTLRLFRVTDGPYAEHHILSEFSSDERPLWAHQFKPGQEGEIARIILNCTLESTWTALGEPNPPFRHIALLISDLLKGRQG